MVSAQVRSDLSHAGESAKPDVKASRDLVAFVLGQAILASSRLDSPASMASDTAVA